MNLEDIPPKIRAEIENCHDKMWRMTHLYKIKSKKDVIPLKANFIQSLMIKAIEKMKIIRYFVLKARQMGVSTWWLIWWLDECMFHENFTCGVLAHKWESLTYLMDILKFTYDNMPKHLRPEIQPSAHQLLFPKINSKIFVTLEIRTATLNALHLSEWCFCEEEHLKATIGGVIANKQCHITGETTANGMGGNGYDVYQEAHEDITKSTNGFIRSFFPWYIEPEYRIELDGLNRDTIMKSITHEEKNILKIAKTDWNIDISAEQMLWYRQQKKLLKQDIYQEHPCDDDEAFIATGGKYFDGKKVKALFDESRAYEKKEGFADYGNSYVMFKAPVKGHIYGLGCDPADAGQSFSTFKIIDVTTREEVFLFRARCGIDYLYKQVDYWGRKYNNALAGIEDNNHGHAVLLALREVTRYRNIFKRKPSGRLRLDVENKYKYGWHTDQGSRDRMLDELRFAVEGDSTEDVFHFEPEIRFYDQTFFQECLTFIDDEGKVEASEGNKDDCIIATAIAFQMYKLLKKRTRPAIREGIGITLNA